LLNSIRWFLRSIREIKISKALYANHRVLFVLVAKIFLKIIVHGGSENLSIGRGLE
jgi:hypothetical protein